MCVLDHSILHGDTAYGQSELDGFISLHLKLALFHFISSWILRYSLAYFTKNSWDIALGHIFVTNKVVA